MSPKSGLKLISQILFLSNIAFSLVLIQTPSPTDSLYVGGNCWQIESDTSCNHTYNRDVLGCHWDNFDVSCMCRIKDDNINVIYLIDVSLVGQPSQTSFNHIASLVQDVTYSTLNISTSTTVFNQIILFDKHQYIQLPNIDPTTIDITKYNRTYLNDLPLAISTATVKFSTTFGKHNVLVIFDGQIQNDHSDDNSILCPLKTILDNQGISVIVTKYMINSSAVPRDLQCLVSNNAPNTDAYNAVPYLAIAESTNASSNYFPIEAKLSWDLCHISIGATPTISSSSSLEIYFFYNETNATYWTTNSMKYGDIIQQAAFLALKNVTGYSMKYEDRSEYTNQSWTYAGITNWNTCYIFNMKVTNSANCPSIPNPNPAEFNAQFVAVNEFDIIADTNVSSFTDWLITELNSQSFIDYFDMWRSQLADIEINNIVVTSINPTLEPTNNPTLEPTLEPTYEPTLEPTNQPIPEPTTQPSTNPTKSPSTYPTKSPTKYPTKSPSKYPTTFPTISPTKYPTQYPSIIPTTDPTKAVRIISQKDGTPSLFGILIGLLIGIAAFIIIVLVACYFYRWKKKNHVDNNLSFSDKPKPNQPKHAYEKVSNGTNIELMPQTAQTINIPQQTCQQLIGEINTEDSDGENYNDTVFGSKECEVKQWFVDNVKLKEEYMEKYYNLFIHNGYDVVSSFRYIDKNELIMMGINKSGHQKVLLNAINNCD